MPAELHGLNGIEDFSVLVTILWERRRVEAIQSINKGEGGYAEDHEYFGELANL